MKTIHSMKPIRLLAATFAAALLAGTGSAFAQRYYEPTPGPYAYHDGHEAFENRGFQDGAIGADRDFQNHRRPNVNNRDEYRNPNFIPAWGQREYREGFRRGYYERARQIYGDFPRYR